MKRLIWLLLISTCFAQTWSKYNGVTVGTSTGNVSSWNGVTIGTTAGNIGAWNTLASPGGGGTPTITVVQAVEQCVNSNSMTFTVGNTYNDNSTTFATPTAGHFMVALTAVYNTAFDISSVVDDGANSFTQDGSPVVVAGPTNHHSVWHYSNVAAGRTSFTINYAVSGYFCGSIVELSTTGTLAYDSKDTTGTQNYGTWSSFSYTPTASKSIINLGWSLDYGGGATFNVDAGYTNLSASAILAGAFKLGVGYQTVSNSSGGYVVSGTWTSFAQNNTTTAVTYRAN